jgi:hypothetical protein
MQYVIRQWYHEAIRILAIVLLILGINLLFSRRQNADLIAGGTLQSQVPRQKENERADTMECQPFRSSHIKYLVELRTVPVFYLTDARISLTWLERAKAPL